MDIVYVLIGFACGFLCREIILIRQVSIARKRFEVVIESMKKDIEQLPKKEMKEL